MFYPSPRMKRSINRFLFSEDVRIMCICHGSFHSPAEFVKHAGGTDTTNPLKHIVVNPNSSSLVFLASNPPVFEFLEKDIRGGSCCVTAFVHKGDLVVSNAGDCRAVMSQGGVAEALTVDHRPSLIEERERIESLGGYVDCCDGGEYIDLLLYPEQLEIAI